MKRTGYLLQQARAVAPGTACRASEENPPKGPPPHPMLWYFPHVPFCIWTAAVPSLSSTDHPSLKTSRYESWFLGGEKEPIRLISKSHNHPDFAGSALCLLQTPARKDCTKRCHPRNQNFKIIILIITMLNYIKNDK